MIKHKTFTERTLAGKELLAKQDALRAEVAKFLNESNVVRDVFNVSEIMIPDEGVFTVTVWYLAAEPQKEKQRDLRPEELSAELLDRAVHAKQSRDAFDMLADKKMVHSSSR